MDTLLTKSGQVDNISRKATSTVFIVDAEPVISHTIGEILRLCGFEAHSFVNPLEALAAARGSAPDLLISDVMMPELSGVELAIRLKALCPECKVLIFSGRPATADLLKQAREKGHDFELLQKPVHPSILISRVNDITRTG